LTSTAPRSRYSKRSPTSQRVLAAMDDRIRLGRGLQTGGEVRRFADNRLFLRRALADQITDDYHPSGNSNPRLQLDGFDIEVTDSVDDPQPRTHRALGIVLMRPRVAEVDQNAVAHILGDKPVEAPDGHRRPHDDMRR
jgi:hypothetical protein